MFGFVLGTMCLVGLGMMARRRRYWRSYAYGYGPGGHYGYGHGCGHDAHHGWHGHHGHHGPGHHGHHGHGPWQGHGWGGGRSRWWRGGLALALRRLQATPDQEQVIREELDTLASAFREHREEWRASRHDVAEAVRAESFDATIMGELFGRHDERLTDMRKAVMEALGRIHAVLDDTQRQRLAEMIDQGRGAWHPFRGGEA